MIDIEEIAAFLTDRYDEDEAAAKAAAYEASCVAVSADEDEGCDRWRAIEGGEGITTESAYAGTAFLVAPLGYLEEEVGTHITRHDPTAVLTDLATKRAILAAYVQAKADFDAAAPHARDVSAFDGGILTGHMVGLREAVTMLAAEFAGHPKFKPEWSVA